MVKVRPPLSKVKSSGEQGEALDGFILGEVVVRRVDFLLDQSVGAPG